jgi:DNA-binding response OmpR family regulator
MKPSEVTRAAMALGYTLLRQRKHLVWRHELTGALVTTSSSPSDRRAIHHEISRLRRFALPAT